MRYNKQTTNTRSTALFQDYPGEPVQKGKTNLDFTEARDSEWPYAPGPYASLHLAPDRQPCQHPTTQVQHKLTISAAGSQAEMTDDALNAESPKRFK